MQKHYKVMLIGLVLPILICVLSSCRMEESYKEFFVEGIENFGVDDYLYSDKLNFARINDTFLLPEIKEAKHGEYDIYISAYSSTEADSVVIRSVVVTDSQEEIIFNTYTSQPIALIQTSESIYYGWTSIGTIYGSDNRFKDGMKLKISIQAEAESDAKSIEKAIAYDITVKGYMSWVVPV